MEVNAFGESKVNFGSDYNCISLRKMYLKQVLIKHPTNSAYSHHRHRHPEPPHSDWDDHWKVKISSWGFEILPGYELAWMLRRRLSNGVNIPGALKPRSCK